MLTDFFLIHQTMVESYDCQAIWAYKHVPLTAVTARGAGDNMNDDVENVDKVLLVSDIFLVKCCLCATLL